MTISDFLKDIQARILPVSGEFALPEAERILGYLLNCTRSELYLDRREQPPSPEFTQKIEIIITRRLTREPLAYILGSAFFYHKEFIVTHDVLIPRPDTEILVEEVLKHETAEHCRFLDIGTGSGCITAALAEQHTRWRAMATDLSYKALTIARKNCHPEVILACVNLIAAIKKNGSFDFIVSNPPYIKTDELPLMQPSVRDFEPVSALDGGNDGLDFYYQLAKTTPPLLKPRGRIYCEIGYDQGQTVPDIFRACGWTGIKVTRDYGGHTRVIIATKPPARSL